MGYELSISKTFVEDKIIRECLETPSQLVPFAVMEVSYMLNAGFMSRGQLIADVGKLSSLERVCISHGRSDFVCQPVSAYRLRAKRWASSTSRSTSTSSRPGHSDTEPGLVSSMMPSPYLRRRVRDPRPADAKWWSRRRRGVANPPYNTSPHSASASS